MKYHPFDSFWKRGVNAKANLENFGRRAYLERKHSKLCDRQDLLSYLLAAKDPDTGNPLPEEEIIAESISFIVGGSDTTSSTMTNFIDYVSRDKMLLGRIHAELDAAYPGPLGPDWVADNDTAGTLSLLNATLREVMRLRPTSATGLERVTPKGGRTIGGSFIPEGVSTHQQTDVLHEPHTLL
jgi:benzoate 4-monooxygenase